MMRVTASGQKNVFFVIIDGQVMDSLCSYETSLKFSDSTVY
jgi:hypothetical protein